MSGQTTSKTRASTVGLLPDIIGVVLLGVVVGTILLYGSQLGYPIQYIAVIEASGIAAALGVRIAATGSSRNIVIGVTTLWLSALAFTGGTVLLVLRQFPAELTATLASITIASAALLGPFGVVTNTIRTYGQGAGSAVLGRYWIGTVLLTLLVGGLGAVSVLRVLGVELLVEPLPAASAIVGVFDSLSARVAVAVGVYTVAFLILPRAVRSFPAEVFVRVSDLDRLSSFRQFIGSVSRYGLGLVFAYLCISVFALRVSVAPNNRSEADVMELLVTIALPITRAGASQSVVVTVATATTLAVVAIITLGRLRGIRAVSGAAIAEAVVPPAILSILVLSSATVFANQLPVSTLESQLSVFVAPGSPVYEVITSRLRLVLLGVGTLAILISGFVLCIPIFIAGGTPGDKSLTGLIASVISLTVLVIVAIFEGESLGIILLGVASIAIVWELGEFATVAAGELQSERGSAGLPAGLTTLLSVHTVVTLCVTAVGAAVVVGLTAVAVSATLPLIVALPAVGITVVGLATLMLLLTG